MMRKMLFAQMPPFGTKKHKLHSVASVNKQHWDVIGCVAFFDDVGRDDFPLAIFEILPLVRIVLCDAETCFEYVTVIATRFPRNTEPVTCSRVHYLVIEPVGVLHRRIVSLYCQRYAKKRKQQCETH